MKEAGLTHGGFYAHFKSRDALLAEATQRAGRDTGAVLAERLRQAQAQGMSPFAALVETYLADAQLENAECGCLVAALASERPRQAEDVASAARARVLGLIDWCAEPCRAASTRRRPSGRGHPGRHAATGAYAPGKAGKAWLAHARASLIQQYDV